MIWKKVKRMPLSVRGWLVRELGEGSELKKMDAYVVTGDKSLLVRRCSACGHINLIYHGYNVQCTQCGEFGAVALDKTD
jgi:ribosomal protein S27E